MKFQTNLPKFSELRLKWLERKRRRETVEKWLELSKNAPTELPPMKIGKISFLLILVRDGEVQEAERNIRKAIDICIEANGIIMAIASSLLYVTFGSHPADQVYDREAEMDRNRRQALEMLRVGMGADVKLVTFTKEASYGTYGTPSYMVYGAIVPAFSKYLGAIAEAEFGEALELDGEP